MCRFRFRGPECKQCHNEAEKNRDKSHRVTITYEYKRRERMRRLYGMTPEEFDAMFEAQGRKCAICPSTVPGKNRTAWCIDHSHATGAVRAILCHDCNTMLGNAKDDPEILMAAVAYLLEHEREPRD